MAKFMENVGPLRARRLGTAMTRGGRLWLVVDASPRVVSLQPPDGGAPIPAYVPTAVSRPVEVGSLVMVRAHDRKPKAGVPVDVKLRIAKVIKPNLPGSFGKGKASRLPNEYRRWMREQTASKSRRG
ncbi:hypothetical protein GCM10020000_82530 [Streptomyces olivoverticillatus]